MNKSILQNGDLLFMSDESDLSKAIIETTEKYSHVEIKCIPVTWDSNINIL